MKNQTWTESSKLTRLIALLQWQGILSYNEALSAISAYRMGDFRWGGGEAVSHYGGARKLINDAVRNRSTYRYLKRDNSLGMGATK